MAIKNVEIQTNEIFLDMNPGYLPLRRQYHHQQPEFSAVENLGATIGWQIASRLNMFNSKRYTQRNSSHGWFEPKQIKLRFSSEKQKTDS